MSFANEPFEPADPNERADPFCDDPIVAAPARAGGNRAFVVLFGVAGIGLFFALNAFRTENAQASLLSSTALASASSSYEAPPLELAPPIPTVLPTPAPILAPQALSFGASVDPAVRRRAATIVVDLQTAPANQGAIGQAAADHADDGHAAPVVVTAPPSAGEPSPLLSGGQAAPAGSYAQFEGRGEVSPSDAAVATQMHNLGALITQGAIVPAILETAINSDLPGYARAIVSRDVRGFDGRNVLIPRGSRLIGQYRSAIALGQSRIFVIWTRVIRPDGVSVQIASPGGDALGRGGLEGDVNRHFFTRFGGSILLSVLNAGIASIGRTPSTEITIGSPAAAASTAASVSFGGADHIVPTISVAQGEAISIFVARDLDFSGVDRVR